MNTNIVGLIGELQACTIFDRSKANLELQYISCFPIQDEKGAFFQVDTLVICTKGIFCIEVKNWEAQIHCSSQYYWDVQYASGSYHVHSPVDQNYQHCRKFEAVCKQAVNSIILFTDSATLFEPPQNVMYVSDFIPYLAGLPTVLNSEEISKLYDASVKYKQSAEVAMITRFIFKNLS